jgi:HlyD family secretion protein
MSASASIQTTRVDSAIAIPLQSITTRSDIIPDSVRSKMGINESLEQVFVINNDNKVEIRTVTTGIQDLTKIQVITGVEEEEMIVTGPFTAISKQLKKDAKVKIVTEDKLIKPAKKI